MIYLKKEVKIKRQRGMNEENKLHRSHKSRKLEKDDNESDNSEIQK